MLFKVIALLFIYVDVLYVVHMTSRMLSILLAIAPTQNMGMCVFVFMDVILPRRWMHGSNLRLTTC